MRACMHMYMYSGTHERACTCAQHICTPTHLHTNACTRVPVHTCASTRYGADESYEPALVFKPTDNSSHLTNFDSDGSCLYMCIDMCLDMCINLYIDMCIDKDGCCLYTHAPAHTSVRLPVSQSAARTHARTHSSTRAHTASTRDLAAVSSAARYPCCPTPS